MLSRRAMMQYILANSLIKLDTPVISLNEDILNIQEVPHAQRYRIYANGVLQETIIIPMVEQVGNQVYIENAKAIQNGSEVSIS